MTSKNETMPLLPRSDKKSGKSTLNTMKTTRKNTDKSSSRASPSRSSSKKKSSSLSLQHTKNDKGGNMTQKTTNNSRQPKLQTSSNPCGLGTLVSEEKQCRDMIEMSEQIAFQNIQLGLQGSLMQFAAFCASRAAQQQDSSASSNIPVMLTRVENINNNMSSLSDHMDALKDDVGKFLVNVLPGASEIQEIRVQNEVLRLKLKESEDEIARNGAEIEELQGRIRRSLMHKNVEHDIIRSSILDQMTKTRVDVEHMQRVLRDYIDKTLAVIHHPAYAGALLSLKEYANSCHDEIQKHANDLHLLIHSVSADYNFYRVDESDTMHSNLPSLYRMELRKMTSGQLLNMLDIVSFQDGVPEAVGRALYTCRESKNLQNVL